MRNTIWATLALVSALPAQAAVTVYTDKAAFVAAANAVQYSFTSGSLTGGDAVDSPYALGPAQFSADQLFLYNDGFYNGQVYLAASGAADPDDEHQTLDGTLSITSTGNGLGLDLGSQFGAGTFNYLVNGVAGSLSLTGEPDTSFIGFIDDSPISAAFAEPGNQELDVVHVYGASSAVPEPAGWMTMIAGFLGIGAVLRTRRTRAAAC